VPTKVLLNKKIKKRGFVKPSRMDMDKARDKLNSKGLLLITNRVFRLARWASIK
jgi:hypothetical protein